MRKITSGIKKTRQTLPLKPKSKSLNRLKLAKISVLVLAILTSSIIGGIFIHSLFAGNLDSPGVPSTTMKTLDDIYCKLTGCVPASHSLDPSAALAPTMHTSQDIYDAAPDFKDNPGDATEGHVCQGKTFYTDSAVQETGNISIPASHVGVGYSACGENGTLLKDLYNGSGSGGNCDTIHGDLICFTQAVGGVDDYNGIQAIPADSYQTTWVTCHTGTTPDDEGNNWCGTGDTNAEKIDLATGLIWSGSLGANTWFGANNCKTPAQLNADGIGDGTCNTHLEAACRCVKLTDPDKTGCEALGDGGWKLPFQKQFMQAYIDGSRANLSSPNCYWSATTVSTSTQRAWNTCTHTGSTGYRYAHVIYKPHASFFVRCVRQPCSSLLVFFLMEQRLQLL